MITLSLELVIENEPYELSCIQRSHSAACVMCVPLNFRDNCANLYDCNIFCISHVLS